MCKYACPHVSCYVITTPGVNDTMCYTVGGDGVIQSITGMLTAQWSIINSTS